MFLLSASRRGQALTLQWAIQVVCQVFSIEEKFLKHWIRKKKSATLAFMAAVSKRFLLNIKLLICTNKATDFLFNRQYCLGKKQPLISVYFHWKMENRCSDLLKHVNINGNTVYQVKTEFAFCQSKYKEIMCSSRILHSTVFTTNGQD